MKVTTFYSHLNGYEWLLVQRPALWKEITSIIESIDANKYRTKESKEKTKAGKLLYAPIEINAAFKRAFDKAGWKGSRTDYWVTDDLDLVRKTVGLSPKEQKALIEQAGKRAIASYNQTDFVKERVAIEVQFGKYTFIPFDLFVKHLAFYVGDKIDLGVELVPMKAMQDHMSSGPGYYERVLYDIARQGRGVPAVPLILIGAEP